jgi:hypothetical protein
MAQGGSLTHGSKRFFDSWLKEVSWTVNKNHAGKKWPHGSYRFFCSQLNEILSLIGTRMFFDSWQKEVL